MKSFITNHFIYCPIVGMFCSRKMDNQINNVHRKTLRVAHTEYDSSFEGSLSKDNSSTNSLLQVKIDLCSVMQTPTFSLGKSKGSFSTEIMKKRREFQVLDERKLSYKNKRVACFQNPSLMDLYHFSIL